MATFTPPASIATLMAAIDVLARERAVAAYAVGGTVRDALLGRAIHDLDVAVDRDALAFGRALADALGGHFVELDDANAIARIVLARDRSAGAVAHIDVAQLQGTLEDDLQRRDFTINALAAPLLGGDVIDATGGLDDLRAGIIRMRSAAALDDDALRPLRGARIASELGFAIEPATSDAIRERAPAMRGAAAERRRDEIARILTLRSAYQALLLLDALALLDALLPEVTFGRGVTQPGDWHAYDVFEHNLRAVEAIDLLLAGEEPAGAAGGEAVHIRREFWSVFAWCARELRAYLVEEMSEGRPRVMLLRLAALLHDVAKPQTRSVDDEGRVRFLGHAEEGATTAGRIMRRLRFSAAETRFVQRLVGEHLRPVQLAQVGDAPTRRALYRFYRDLGDAVPAVLMISLADMAASRGPRLESAEWSRHVRYMNSLLVRSYDDEGILDPPRLLSGDDIMSRFGLKEGPAIGRVLEALREAQGAGEVTDREQAWQFVAAQVAADQQGRQEKQGR